MRRYTLEVSGKTYVVDVDEITADRYRVQAEGQEYEVRLSGDEDLAEGRITPEMAPPRVGPVASAAPRPVVTRAPAPAAPTVPAVPAGPPPAPAAVGNPEAVAGGLTAPMPGKVLSVEVNRGDRVSRGQILLYLEAMKMKNAIKAPYDGVVMEVAAQAGQAVAHGQLLLKLGQG